MPCQSLFEVFNVSSDKAPRIKSHVCVRRPCITWPLRTSVASFSSMLPLIHDAPAIFVSSCFSNIPSAFPVLLRLLPRLPAPLSPPPLDLSSDGISSEALLDRPPHLKQILHTPPLVTLSHHPAYFLLQYLLTSVRYLFLYKFMDMTQNNK